MNAKCVQFGKQAFSPYCIKIFREINKVHVPNFGGCQGRRTGVGVTTVSNSLILGGWVTKVLKNGDEKQGLEGWVTTMF